MSDIIYTLSALESAAFGCGYLVQSACDNLGDWCEPEIIRTVPFTRVLIDSAAGIVLIGPHTHINDMMDLPLGRQCKLPPKTRARLMICVNSPLSCRKGQENRLTWARECLQLGPKCSTSFRKYTVSRKKWHRYTFVRNFAKCSPILIFFTIGFSSTFVIKKL